MQFTETQQHRRKLTRNGSMYTYHKPLANGETTWECVKRRSGRCQARLQLTATDEFKVSINEHSHAPSEVQCEVAKVKANIKRRAETTNDSAGSSWRANGYIGECQSTIRSQRTINENLPPVPSRKDVIPVLPQTYQTNSTGEQSLLFDSGVGDAERLFIFGSPQATQLLTQSPHWLFDGTFKVVPELLNQMLARAFSLVCMRCYRTRPRLRTLVFSEK